MPTITIRLNKEEKAALEDFAHRAGQTTSDYVRETLNLRAIEEDVLAGMNARIEELWRKVERLEGMAGIDA